MEGVSSAAIALLLPAGAAHDPAGMEGAASVGAEWALRGAGNMDTRALNDALDSLGIQHDESVLSEHAEFSMALLGANLPRALELLGDIVRRPALGDDAFDACRELTLQDLASLEDEPARKCNVLLRERFFPHPFGRNVFGQAKALEAMKAGALRNHLQAVYSPRGAILAVAGMIDWDSLRRMVEQIFGDWSTPLLPRVEPGPSQPGMLHVPKDSAQQQIALAHRAVVSGDSRSYAALMAEKVLSGGMSGRLFTEVREKRGLVYHVSTRYASLKDWAGFFTYAGTRPEAAQETLDVTIAELRRLSQGITDAEMARARTQLKSTLIMQGESTMARANALAGDWYHLGRLRGLEEINAAIEAVKTDDVLNYLAQFPADDFTAVILGPRELTLPE
jgi:predicted Zn-dependent peptidase